MNKYNRTVHKITSFNPNEAFYNKNEELHKIVYNNILDYYNKIQKMILYLT